MCWQWNTISLNGHWSWVFTRCNFLIFRKKSQKIINFSKKMTKIYQFFWKKLSEFWSFYIVFAFWICESGECFILFVGISMVLKEIVIESESMFKSRLCLTIVCTCLSFFWYDFIVYSIFWSERHPSSWKRWRSRKCTTTQWTTQITIIAMEPEKIAKLFL